MCRHLLTPAKRAQVVMAPIAARPEHLSSLYATEPGKSYQPRASFLTLKSVGCSLAGFTVRFAVMTADSSDITRLLTQWSGGDPKALDELIPSIYEELRRLARRALNSERPDHTLQTTAVVHEAYLRLVDQNRTNWQNRSHFFAIASQLIRRILVDHARSRRREKRGGGAAPVSLDEALLISGQPEFGLVALDDALKLLAERDPRRAQVVELKFFGGLSAEEIAAVLDVSAVTVMRDWNLAKAWLYRELHR